MVATCVAGVTGVMQAQAAHHATSHTVSRPAEPPPTPPIITLERSACNGQCAEYKLSFYDDGLVVYEGKANASKAGRWQGHIEKDVVTSLVNQFNRLRYDTLQANYGAGLTPSPIATTSLRKGDQTKTVVHDTGSPFSPAFLSALEDQLDVTVSSINWTR